MSARGLVLVAATLCAGCASLRADGPWAALPIIALSTHSSDRNRNEGLEAGFGDYVAKFNRDMLIDTLDQAIAQRALRADGGEE